MEHRNGVLLALAIGLYALNSIGTPLKVLLWTVVWYFTGGGHSIYLFRNTIVRDYRRALVYNPLIESRHGRQRVGMCSTTEICNIVISCSSP